MNVLSLRIYFSAPLHFHGWRCRFNSRSDTTCWLLCDATNTQTNIRLFQARLHSLNKWRQSLLYSTGSPPPLSASLNFLHILHLPTYIKVRAPLPLSTHLHLPLLLFLRHLQFLRLSLYLFLFPSPRFFFLFATSPSIFCYSSSSVFPTLVSYPLIAKFLHFFLSPLPSLSSFSSFCLPLQLAVSALVTLTPLLIFACGEDITGTVCAIFSSSGPYRFFTILAETKWHSLLRRLYSLN